MGGMGRSGFWGIFALELKMAMAKSVGKSRFLVAIDVDILSYPSEMILRS